MLQDIESERFKNPPKMPKLKEEALERIHQPNFPELDEDKIYEILQNQEQTKRYAK